MHPNNKITFIINGQLRKKNELQDKIILNFSDEFEIDFKITLKPKDAIILAQNAVSAGTNFLIAIGGDGTLHEVVNGLMNCSKEKRNNVAVGILPSGSGNDFARTIQINSELKSLYNLIKKNLSHSIDVGKVEVSNFENTREIKYFINIAEVGLGADVVRRVNSGSKILNPTLNFFKSSLFAFFSYKKQRLKVLSDNFHYSGDVLVLCFANGKYFGSGLQIAPHAKIDDGKLALFLAGNVSLFDYLKNLINIRKGYKIMHPQIQYSEVSSCIVESDSTSLVEADGELLGKLPAKFSILPNEILFLTKSGTNDNSVG